MRWADSFWVRGVSSEFTSITDAGRRVPDVSARLADLLDSLSIRSRRYAGDLGVAGALAGLAMGGHWRGWTVSDLEFVCEQLVPGRFSAEEIHEVWSAVVAERADPVRVRRVVESWAAHRLRRRSDLGVWEALVGHARDLGLVEFSVSQRQLVERSGLSHSSVMRGLGELVALGRITLVDPGSDLLAATYLLNVHRDRCCPRSTSVPRVQSVSAIPAVGHPVWSVLALGPHARELLAIVEQHGPCTVAEVNERFVEHADDTCSARTVRRYLHQLRDRGALIEERRGRSAIFTLDPTFDFEAAGTWASHGPVAQRRRAQHAAERHLQLQRVVGVAQRRVDDIWEATAGRPPELSVLPLPGRLVLVHRSTGQSLAEVEELDRAALEAVITELVSNEGSCTHHANHHRADDPAPGPDRDDHRRSDRGSRGFRTDRCPPLVSPPPRPPGPGLDQRGSGRPDDHGPSGPRSPSRFDPEGVAPQRRPTRQPQIEPDVLHGVARPAGPGGLGAARDRHQDAPARLDRRSTRSRNVHQPATNDQEGSL